MNHLPCSRVPLPSHLSICYILFTSSKYDEGNQGG